jgi:hypothetical protein
MIVLLVRMADLVSVLLTHRLLNDHYSIKRVWVRKLTQVEKHLWFSGTLRTGELLEPMFDSRWYEPPSLSSYDIAAPAVASVDIPMEWREGPLRAHVRESIIVTRVER